VLSIEHLTVVIPANAGIQRAFLGTPPFARITRSWIPAFAGMTRPLKCVVLTIQHTPFFSGDHLPLKIL